MIVLKQLKNKKIKDRSATVYIRVCMGIEEIPYLHFDETEEVREVIERYKRSAGIQNDDEFLKFCEKVGNNNSIRTTAVHGIPGEVVQAIIKKTTSEDLTKFNNASKAYEMYATDDEKYDFSFFNLVLRSLEKI